jgi:tetratricopeptide (TPR) repeat protein
LPEEISDDLKKLIKRCLSSAQEKRYQDWEQVIMALEDAYVSLASKAIPAEETEKELERVDQIALGLGYGRLGVAYFDLGKSETALLYFEKSAEIASAQHDIVTQAVALNSLGAAYLELSQELKALEYFERSLKLKYEIGEPDTIITTLDNIGIAHAKLGHREASIKKWEDALSLAREINDEYSEARILSNVGIQYKDLGDQRALKYFEQALVIDKKIGNLMGVGLNSLNLADLYVQQDQDSRALILAKEALFILSEIGSPKIQLAENVIKQLQIREAMKLYNMGDECKEKGDFQEAIDYYSKALNICREVGEERGQVFALGGLGLVYQELKVFLRAIECFEKAKQLAIQFGLEDHVALNAYRLAVAYLSKDDFFPALALSREAAKIWRKLNNPKAQDAQELQAETLNGLGEASRKRGALKESIEYYYQSLSITRDINYRYGEGIELGNLGLAYFHIDDNQKALKYLELAIIVNQETGNTEALAKNQFNMALLLHELGKDVRALSFAQESMENFLKIGSPEVQEAQQIIVALTQLTGKQKGFWGKLFGKGNKDGSSHLDSYESKKSTGRQDHDRRSLSARAVAQIYFVKAMVFRQQNSLREASECFQKAIAADPDYTEAYYNLGVLHHKQGYFQAAEEFYRKAILMDTSFASAHYNLGLLLHDQRRIHEAEESWQKAIAADPNFSRAYYNLGLLYHDQKRLHDAESFYCKAIEADPKNAEAYMNLGNVFSTQKRRKEAEKAYRKSIIENPSDARAYYNLGNLLVEQKRLDEAENAYRKSISVNPNFADAYQNLGVVLKSRNRLTEANSMFAKARQLDMN